MAEAFKELKPFFDLIGDADGLNIMLVLTGAHVLYEDLSIISHPRYGTVQLDPQGRDICDRMLGENSIDLGKLEGHYAKVKDIRKLPYPVKREPSPV